MDTAPDTTSDTDGAIPASYIRTFAKDYAALSGGKTPEPLPSTTNSKKTLFAKKEQVVLDEPDVSERESLITRVSNDYKPQELSELEESANEREDEAAPILENIGEDTDNGNVEPISLPRIEPGDIIQKVQKPKPSPIPTPKPQAHQNTAPAHVYAPVQELSKPVFVGRPVETTYVPPAAVPVMTPTPVSAPVSLEKEPAKPVEPPVSPTPITTPPVIPSIIPVDPEREAILARLKARVANHSVQPDEKKSVEMPVPPPTPPVRAPEPVVSKPIATPVTPFIPVSVPVPPITPIPTLVPPTIKPLPSTPPVYREPIPADEEVVPSSNSFHKIEPVPMAIPVSTPIPLRSTTGTQGAGPEALHTYKSDFSDHLQENNSNVFSVIAAERDAHPAAPVRGKSNLGPRIAIIFAAIFLLILGAGGVYEAYIFMNKSAPVPLIQVQPALILSDSSVTLTGTGQTLVEALAQEANQPIAANHIVSTTVTGGDIMSALALPAPDILLRNIDSSSMAGVVNAGGETRPFFILHVTSYERTFSGMLTWESTMYNDLALLYPKYSAPTPQATSSDTSTSTDATSTPIVPIATVDKTQPNTEFTDEIVANRNARVLTDLAGRTLLIYGYADPETLIIARNEAAFTLLVSRLQPTTSN